MAGHGGDLAPVVGAMQGHMQQDVLQGILELITPGGAVRNGRGQVLVPKSGNQALIPGAVLR